MKTSQKFRRLPFLSIESFSDVPLIVNLWAASK